ncbi:hypothetical protein [Pedobacter cryoconitis]|uniref:hypothetical protein n=1 Tax=Pedobacter cryoconitis TaxID=188932 RepID=UPI001612DF57|nr:hypothetical protein [Pedobacter cryoconitis]MBB5644880.1 flagellar biosynthesis protein FliQ [Pedobacter cryoconitis]
MKLKLSYSITIYLIVVFIIAYVFSNLGSIQEHTLGFIFYLVLIVIAFYFFLSRYSCKLDIYGSTLHIRYLMPWNKNVHIDLKSFKYFDYGRGFYNLISERKKGFMNLLRYPYDTIVLSEGPDFSTNILILKVNLRLGQFNKLLNYLKTSVGLNLTDSNGSGGYFW